MSKNSDEASTQSGAEIYATGQVSWDLTAPVTRERAGLSEDRTTAVFQNLDSPEWLNATFEIAPDRSVVATATTMVINTDQQTGLPKTIALDTKGLTLDEALIRLRDLATQLAIDDTEVDTWHASAQSRIAGDPSQRRSKTMRGDAAVELTAAAGLGEDRVAVTITFYVNQDPITAS